MSNERGWDQMNKPRAGLCGSTDDSSLIAGRKPECGFRGGWRGGGWRSRAISLLMASIFTMHLERNPSTESESEREEVLGGLSGKQRL